MISSVTAKIVSCTKYRSLMDSAASVDKVLSSFAAHQIQLMEWENHLLQRLRECSVAKASD